MHVPKLNPLMLVAVTLTLVAAACARDHHAAAPTRRPARVATAAPVVEAALEPVPEAPKPRLSRAELEAEFDVQKHKIDEAVHRLEREHSVYAMESPWYAKIFAWWPWEKKRDREAIGALIQDIERAAERQVEIARELGSADLAVKAEAERYRATQLLESLSDFNAHDHNPYQD